MMSAGRHLIAPWNEVSSYNLEEQRVEREVVGLTQNGNRVQWMVTVGFRPLEQDLGKLHQTIGPDYVERVVWPEVESHCRLIMGKFGQNELRDLPDEALEAMEREIERGLSRCYVRLEAFHIVFVEFE